MIDTRWVTGVLLTVVLLMSGWLYTGVQTRADRMAEAMQDQGQQIATLGAQYRAIEGRLVRIESGVDRMSEQLRRERP